MRSVINVPGPLVFGIPFHFLGWGEDSERASERARDPATLDTVSKVRIGAMNV